MQGPHITHTVYTNRESNMWFSIMAITIVAWPIQAYP